MSGRAEWLLGVDIGTSSVKALAVSPGRGVLAAASVEHPMHRPRPGHAENDPDDWLRGVVAAVAQLTAAEGVDGDAVAGLAIVAQRDPWVLLDARGRPLAPAISWTDSRTQPDVDELCARFGRTWLIDRTGVLPIPGLGLPVLHHVARHAPDVWAATRRLLSPKDYVLKRLTGLVGTDLTTPSRSVMNDVRRNAWDAEICDACGIALELLPPISWRPWEPIAELPAESAALLGLRSGVPVAAGGGDDQAATLGAGAFEVGDLCAGTGTGSDWRLVTADAVPDSELARGDVAPHVVAGRHVFEVCIESTGSSLRWFRDALGDGASYAELVAEAARVAPGADGLLALPFVDGAGRAPWFVERASASFLGIVSGHTRAHFVRALLEGVAYQYPPTLELIAPGRDPARPIALVDGETRSESWNQLKADVTGVPIQTPEVAESAALGAAILAGQAAGRFASAADGVRELVRMRRTYEPDPARHARYRELRARHEQVFRAVSPTYAS
jgi:sugar (pentulose or hexulose) kinase